MTEERSDIAVLRDPRQVSAELIALKFRPAEPEDEAERQRHRDAEFEATAPAYQRPMGTPSSGRYSHLKLRRNDPALSYAFTDDAKDRFCERYAQCGVIYLAAAAAGVCLETVRQHRKTDTVFLAAFEEAHLEYCAGLEAEIHRRGVEGVKEPVIGRVGKDEDGIITYVRRYSDRLLEFQAKKNIPDYRERTSQDVHVTGGVMVLSAPVATAGEALDRIRSRQLERRELVAERQQAIEAELVNVTPAKGAG